MTYSITAWDPESGRFGVAVQSCVLAVGTRVPRVHSGQGAISVQAGYRSWYRTPAADLLTHDLAAADVVAALRALPDADVGQAAVVDRFGRAAAHTGPACTAAAGHIVADGVVVAGNLLSNNAVWPAMLQAYQNTAAEFVDRLYAALRAGEDAGGDVRGSQSAAILVTGSADFFDVDIRVDDAPDPIGEIGRVLTVKRAHDLFRKAPNPADDPGRAAELLENAAAQAPGDRLVTVWAGIAAASTGDRVRAAGHLRRAYTQNPRLVDYLEREPELRHHPQREQILALAREVAD